MDNPTNPIVAFMRSQIGQDSKNSPSAAGRFLNGVLKEVDAGRLVMEYTIHKEMINPVGGLHGGMTALIMDELIGATVFSLHTEYLYTSINLSVDFLRPAKLGDVITATATVVRKGRKVINVDCIIHHQNGKVLAKGTSNMAITDNKSMFANSK